MYKHSSRVSIASTLQSVWKILGMILTRLSLMNQMLEEARLEDDKALMNRHMVTVEQGKAETSPWLARTTLERHVRWKGYEYYLYNPSI